MNLLMARLDLLYSTSTITDRAKLVSTNVIERYVAETEGEKYTMLITHLAMAITRIDRNEELSSPPETIMAEIRSSENTLEALARIHWIEEVLGEALPIEEKEYLLLHFVTVLNR